MSGVPVEEQLRANEAAIERKQRATGARAPSRCAAPFGARDPCVRTPLPLPLPDRPSPHAHLASPSHTTAHAKCAEQDESLDELSAAIARMKSLGEAIGSELDAHNAIVDDIQSGTAKADAEVTKAAAAAVDVKESAGTGCALS